MTLHITEFASIGYIAGVGDVMVAARPTAYQNIVLTGSNQQSAAVNAATTLVEVVADVDAFVCIGANPNATSGIKIKLHAGVKCNYMVAAGDKIAGVTV